MSGPEDLNDAALHDRVEHQLCGAADIVLLGVDHAIERIAEHLGGNLLIDALMSHWIPRSSVPVGRIPLRRPVDGMLPILN